MNKKFSFNLLDKITIKNRLILLTVLVSAVIFVAISTVNCIQSYNNMFNEKRQQLTNAADMAINILNVYAKKVENGELTEQQAQDLAKSAVSNLIYDNKAGYVWIQDYNATMIMHPLKPEMDGKNYADFADKKGNTFFTELSSAVKKENKGFVTYFWGKPNHPEDQLFEKLSYGEGFGQWKWIVGTGVYVDDIKANIIDTVTKNVLYSLVIMIMVIIVANLTIVKSIIKPLQSLTEKCLQLASNDLTVHIPEDNNKTEIGDLTRSVSTLASNMRKLILEIKQKSDQVNTSSQELQSISESSSQVATQVAETIEQMAVGSSSQAKDVTDSAQSIVEISKLSNDAVTNIENGQKDVEKTINQIVDIKNTTENLAGQINKLGGLAQEIGKIVELITNIASQTNLLALNAAIESARAGEHGKGFAVVAEEVKKLAEESAQAANQIKDMIGQIQVESAGAVKSTQVTVAMVEEGVQSVNNVKRIFETIEVSSKESEAKTYQVSQSMENISAIVEETAASNEEISASMQEQNAGMEELSASAQILAELTVELNNSISVFKV